MELRLGKLSLSSRNREENRFREVKTFTTISRLLYSFSAQASLCLGFANGSLMHDNK